MSVTLRSKLQTMLKEQQNDEFLRVAHLPKVPKNNHGPVISQVPNQVRQNHFVVTNDAHNRATNNGFQRNALGGFYAH
jgi:hypothetical protein